MTPTSLNLALPVPVLAGGLTDVSVVTEGDAFMQLLAQVTGVEAGPTVQPMAPDAVAPVLALPLKVTPQTGLEAADAETEEAPQDGDEPEAGTTQPPQLAALMALLTPAPAPVAPAAAEPSTDPAMAVTLSPTVVIANAAPTVATKSLKSSVATSSAVPADVESTLAAEEPMQLPKAVRPAPVVRPEIPMSKAPRMLMAAPAEHIAEPAPQSDLPVVTAAEAPTPITVSSPMPGPTPTETAAVTETSPVHEPVEAQLDLARDGEWLDRLAKDIARSAGQDGSLRFRLNPETLGTLHVEMSQGSAGTSIRLIADTAAAQAIIADAQPKLIAEARAQGVRVAETHVDLSGGGSTSTDARGQRDARQEEIVRTFSVVEPDETPASRVVRTASERYA